MNLNAIIRELRDTSERYGGLKDHLEAAGHLDRAISAFFRESDIETLRELNGALARVQRLRKWKDAEKLA